MATSCWNFPSFEIQDARPSPFTRGFLSFRANFFSFLQVFPPSPSNGRNLFPREFCSPFRFEKRNPIVTGKLTKKKKGRKKKKIREHILKLFFQNNVIYIVIAPAKTGNDIIDKIAVIKTDHGNSEI